jgi:SAM-dependent methyltransferase
MDSKERFSNRVDTYVRYRPSYPKAAIDYLYEKVGFQPDNVIADIGAGTGIFSKLLLERDSRVVAIEPNEAMRKSAEGMLADLEGFQAVSGSAEATGLPDASVDGIVCAQSFHWFDRVAAKAEFRRILKPQGKVALIWNTRLTEGTRFLELYEQLLQTYGTDYLSVNHRNVSEEGLSSFFAPYELHAARFPNGQRFDFDGLRGRLLSSSYSPVPGHPNYEPMMRELQTIFEQTQEEGTVSIDYETEVFWGTLG